MRSFFKAAVALSFSVTWAGASHAQDSDPSEEVPLRQAIEESTLSHQESPDGGVPDVDAKATGESALPPPTVQVHIESGPAVQLERVKSDGTWAVVCRSPCDQAVSTEETYRINAKGKVASASFRLPDEDSRGTTLEVNTASSVLRTVGTAAVVVGALPVSGAAVLFVGGAVIIGVVVILACPFAEVFGGSFGGCAETLFGDAGSAYWDWISKTPVWGTIVGGVALSGSGLVLLGTNRRTRVRQGRTDLALLNEPFPGQPNLPRVVAFPVLSGQF